MKVLNLLESPFHQNIIDFKYDVDDATRQHVTNSDVVPSIKILLTDFAFLNNILNKEKVEYHLSSIDAYEDELKLLIEE